MAQRPAAGATRADRAAARARCGIAASFRRRPRKAAHRVAKGYRSRRLGVARRCRLTGCLSHRL
jgi:hypothetical protein